MSNELMVGWATLPKVVEGESDTPEIVVDEGTTKALIEIVALRRMNKDIDARIKALEALAAPIMHAKLCLLSAQQGKVFSSVTCGDAQYVCQNRYTPLKAVSTVARMRKVYGDRFGSFFAEQYSLEIPVDKIDEELKEVLKRKGFAPTVVLKPTEVYHAASILEEGFKQECKPTAYIQRKAERKS